LVETIRPLRIFDELTLVILPAVQCAFVSACFPARGRLPLSFGTMQRFVATANDCLPVGATA
jgi:hypothetical protein